MFAKNMNIPFLLDFYGEVLSERSREILDLYYNDDMSLAEIAEHEGISRQGVRHSLKKGEEELFFLEEKLGLASRFQQMRRSADALRHMAEGLMTHADEGVRALAEATHAFADTVAERDAVPSHDP